MKKHELHEKIFHDNYIMHRSKYYIIFKSKLGFKYRIARTTLGDLNWS